MKLNIIDSSRGLIFTEQDNCLNINLNSLIRKNYDFTKIGNFLRTKLKDVKEVSISNFASLCYKLHIKYNSQEAIQLLTNIIKAIKQVNGEIIIKECGSKLYNEIGINPFEIQDLLYIESERISMIKPVRDMFTIIGFTNQQVIQCINNHKEKILNYFPKDIIEKIPYKNVQTENFLIKLKEQL